MAESKKVEDIHARVVEVPTQVQEVVELSDGKKVGLLELMVMMYNEIMNIKKGL